MLNTRQNNILKMIVEEYIRLARPVGSKSICTFLNLSSATIRNEMAYLKNRFLEKTHTSSVGCQVKMDIVTTLSI